MNHRQNLGEGVRGTTKGRKVKYPADYVDDEGWARIHQGHGLDTKVLVDDLEHDLGCAASSEVLKVEELHLRYVPRVKWCGTFGFPCDNEGEWHSHWYGVKPSETSRFTVARWSVLRKAQK